MLRFKKSYFFLFLALLLIEVLIALYIHDEIIRPFIGDLLVVILLYALIKSFVNISVWCTAISVLLFSYLVETLQYFRLVELLGLQDYSIARIIIGTSFSWLDILMYTLGIVIIIGIEAILAGKVFN